MGPLTTIALDIMSGDCGPHSRIRAALAALDRHHRLHCVLVGDSHLIQDAVPASANDRVTIVHAPEVVTMDDKPSLALRRKQGSSMWLAVEQVASGHSQGCVSAGNTGALMAIGRHLLKTLPGIDRPALAGQVPTPDGVTLLLDLGANVDCSSDQLYQFAILGSLMMSAVYGKESPAIGLLNVGSEVIKGSERVKLAQQLIAGHPGLNYTGFVEGDDLFSGSVDVVVSDGFPGNVALKASEGVARLVAERLFRGTGLTSWKKLLWWLVRPVMGILTATIDPGRFNGATLLGLQGLVVKSHGASDDRQFGYAIDQAVRAAEQSAVDKINRHLETMI